MRLPVRIALLTVLSLNLAGSVDAASAAPASRAEIVAAAYDGFSMSPPSTSVVTICHNFGCKMTTEVALDQQDYVQLTRMMAQGRGSAEAERRAVATVAAWFDKRVGPLAGTKNHVSKAGVGFTFNSDGQFDCIDSSRNTTTLLLLIDDLKLLRFHVPDQPASRGHIFDGRPPHATAVLTENSSGTSWSIDTWTRAYAQPAEIMPLAEWEERDDY